MDEIIIEENKGKLKELIRIGILILLVEIFLVGVGVKKGIMLPIIIGVIGLLFFGTCFVFMVNRLRKPAPLLVVGEDGIIDRSTMTSVGFIPWRQIKLIKIYKSFNQEFIGIDLYSLKELEKGISMAKRLAIKINIVFKYPPIGISLNTANVECKEVVSLIEKRLGKSILQ